MSYVDILAKDTGIKWRCFRSFRGGGNSNFTAFFTHDVGLCFHLVLSFVGLLIARFNLIDT